MSSNSRFLAKTGDEVLALRDESGSRLSIQRITFDNPTEKFDWRTS